MKLLSVFTLVSLLALPSLASADQAACLNAYEQTQTLRKDGKPVAAKAQAQSCAQSTCPALLTKDCSKWVTELEAMIPTVVLDPRAPTGGLRADVRVKIDGNVVSEKIDGRPLPVEPGAHTFTFEADGALAVEQAVALKDGEKAKKITVTMLPAPTPKAVERPIPLGVWVFGGGSVVALAVGAGFGISGLGKKSDLDACKPRCNPDDVDSLNTRFTVADLALGAGVVAGAAAVYLLLSRPTVEVAGSSSAAKNGAFVIVPFASPLAGGGAGGLSGRF